MAEHPGDDELAALLEDPSARGAAHLAGCADCRARVEGARAVSRTLAKASPLSRAFCPPRELLVSSFEGSLAAAERPRLGAHLAVCPCCRDDLRDLEAVFEPAPVAAPLVTLRARLVLLIDAARRGLELLESSLLPAPAPALVPVRGSATAAASGGSALAGFGAGALQLSWVLGSAGADLLVRSTGAAPRAFRLEVGPAGETAVWESRTSDAEGVVRVEGLAPGTYQVRAFVPQETRPGLLVELDIRRS